MPRVVAKNTFLSFCVDGSDMCEASDSQICTPQASLRSKSAEITRSKPFAETQDSLTQYSVRRLNAMLSVGFTISSQHSNHLDPTSALQGYRNDQVKREPLVGKGHDCSDLEHLQDTLGRALAETATPISEKIVQKPLRAFKHFRNASNGSVSTMAPDDASDCGDSSRSGLGRMPHVWSSGSISSMVLKSDDDLSETGEVQFGLKIEEYNQLAQEASATGNGKNNSGNKDNSHSLVPRNHNLAEIYENSGKHAAPTTLMIRNIPSRYTQQDLMMDLGDMGFAGSFDFLYIPMDTSTLASVGYGFVNFKNSVWAERCMQAFQGFRFKRQRRGAHKLASVSIAHIQGLQRNLQHYEKSAVSASKYSARRPIVMASIENMFC